MRTNIEIPPNSRRRGMKVLCIADLHAKAGFLPAMRNFLANEKNGDIEAIFCLGDIVNAGGDLEYLGNLLSIDNKLPFFYVPGNNDYGAVYDIMKKYSVENKIVEFRGLPADASRPAMQTGEKIIGMGGIPDLYGHNIYYPNVKAEDLKDSIFLSHIPPNKVKNLKKFDHNEINANDLKNAPKIQISGHIHSAWGVGYIGKTKVLKLPAGLDMMAAILDTESLAVEFIDMKKYDRVSLS